MMGSIHLKIAHLLSKATVIHIIKRVAVFSRRIEIKRVGWHVLSEHVCCVLPQATVSDVCNASRPR